jgi:hypothetical protein
MIYNKWLIFGLIVIFTSAIGSFWYKPFGLIMILYIFLTYWYYLTEIKKMSLQDILNKIRGKK